MVLIKKKKRKKEKENLRGQEDKFAGNSKPKNLGIFMHLFYVRKVMIFVIGYKNCNFEGMSFFVVFFTYIYKL